MDTNGTFNEIFNDRLGELNNTQHNERVSEFEELNLSVKFY